MRAFIALGSNITPEDNVRRALDLLGREVAVRRLSTFYRTPPLDRPEQQPFLNGVVEIETALPPGELKSRLWEIEEKLGRQRTADKSAPRTIDLDLVAYSNLQGRFDGLHLPDPEIAERPFLAVPLAELVPDLPLPGHPESLGELAGAMSREGLSPLLAFTDWLRGELCHEP